MGRLEAIHPRHVVPVNMASCPSLVQLGVRSCAFNHGFEVSITNSSWGFYQYASHCADFAFALFHSIVSTATYTIAHDLNVGLGDATWIILAYTITYLGSTVIIARLSDVFGRR